MKNLIKFFLLLVILTSCKTREKEVSKNETKSETFSKSEFTIERKTIDFVFNKSIFTRDFSYRSSAEETGKTDKKNIDKGKANVFCGINSRLVITIIAFPRDIFLGKKVSTVDKISGMD